MPIALANFIVTYGYMSIFLFVFLQEIGVPTFPNELLLLYSGYLAYTGTLNLFLVLLIVVAADMSGTFVLYILFYYCSGILIKYKPKWLPVPYKTIQSLKKQMVDGGRTKVFIGRLIPYLRGYVSVVAGVLHINFRSYSLMILYSALIWSGGYVIIGWIAGPFWSLIFNEGNMLKLFVVLIPSVMVFVFFAKWMGKKFLF